MSQDLEIWLPVVGYEKLYAVSNLGRVKSSDRWTRAGKGRILKKGKILNPEVRYGYHIVRLYDGTGRNSKTGRRTQMVHQLVARAFIPNPKNKPEVNHLNRLRDDNRPENLSWCTGDENMAYYSLTRLTIPKPNYPEAVKKPKTAA